MINNGLLQGLKMVNSKQVFPFPEYILCLKQLLASGVLQFGTRNLKISLHFARLPRLLIIS